MPDRKTRTITRNALVYDVIGEGQASQRLRVTTQSVRDFEKAGKLPVILTADGKRLYPLAAVERLAEERRAAGK